MSASLVIPAPTDDDAWRLASAWLGSAQWSRTPHGLRACIDGQWVDLFPGDALFRAVDGSLAAIFEGRLQRKYAPDLEPEPWDLTIALAHAHGDQSQSYQVVLSLVGGRIDAAELGRRIARFVDAATRPNDTILEITLKPCATRAALKMPSLEELKARAGEVITL